jgi:hypothetical protein
MVLRVSRASRSVLKIIYWSDRAPRLGLQTIYPTGRAFRLTCQTIYWGNRPPRLTLQIILWPDRPSGLLPKSGLELPPGSPGFRGQNASGTGRLAVIYKVIHSSALFLAGAISALWNLRWVKRLPALETFAGTEVPARCSVVIAARDEEARIEDTIRHLFAQPPPSFVTSQPL